MEAREHYQTEEDRNLSRLRAAQVTVWVRVTLAATGGTSEARRFPRALPAEDPTHPSCICLSYIERRGVKPSGRDDVVENFASESGGALQVGTVVLPFTVPASLACERTYILVVASS